MKKLTENINWYRQMSRDRLQIWESPQTTKDRSYRKRVEAAKNTNKIAAVMFVKRSKEGRLVSRLREKEEQISGIIGHRVKLVERAGVSVKTLLWNADPWGGIGCQTEQCPVCYEGQKRIICTTSNAVY